MFSATPLTWECSYFSDLDSILTSACWEFTVLSLSENGSVWKYGFQSLLGQPSHIINSSSSKIYIMVFLKDLSFSNILLMPCFTHCFCSKILTRNTIFFLNCYFKHIFILKTNRKKLLVFKRFLAGNVNLII